MNGLVRSVVCVISLAFCTSLASAESVFVTGNVNFAPNSLTFAPPFTTLTNSGIFSGFSGGNVNYMLGTVAYMDGLPVAQEEAFTITNSTGDVLAFYDQHNSPSQSFNSNGFLQVTLNETGYYTINDGVAMPGTFALSFVGTTPTGSDANVPFLGTGSLFTSSVTGVTPEPGSILLLGTGFLGAAGLLYSRRKA